jgi:predicted DNA-binding transcriptional regulator AlpA
MEWMEMSDQEKRKLAELHPSEIVRLRDGAKFFGFKHSQLDEKIKSGEIPAPFPLSESGRAVGWTGAQIIEHQRRRLAAAKQKVDA